jgi:molecular chaperone DnaK (HSP70)
LKDAGLSVSDIDEVILGGSTRMQNCWRSRKILW